MNKPLIGAGAHDTILRCRINAAFRSQVERRIYAAERGARRNLSCALGAASLVAAVFLAGCDTIPPGAERGPHGTMAYDVLVEASAPGARIEANGADVGNTPVHLKIFGDPDGTFHDFGSPYYAVRALPLTTNQFEQTRFFGTGHWLGPEDHIPKEIYFNMNQPAPAQPPYGPPVYGYPYYGPPVYYGPPYWGPEFRFYIRPPYHRYRRW